MSRAERLAKEAVQLQPNSPNALDTLGWICHKRHAYEAAVAAYQRSLAARPNSPTTHYHLALTYSAQGKRREAKRHVMLALDTRQAFPHAADAKQLLESLEQRP